MSHVEGFTDRDGLDKLVRLGKLLCKTVLLFTPILLAKYPGNELIKDLIAAINVVCQLLPDVENEFLAEEGLNDIPSDTPELIPGINPGLPPAPDPIA
jgi:hypothetical protein